jgi:hypothetical protein
MEDFENNFFGVWNPKAGERHVVMPMPVWFSWCLVFVLASQPSNADVKMNAGK